MRDGKTIFEIIKSFAVAVAVAAVVATVVIAVNLSCIQLNSNLKSVMNSSFEVLIRLPMQPASIFQLDARRHTHTHSHRQWQPLAC